MNGRALTAWERLVLAHGGDAFGYSLHFIMGRPAFSYRNREQLTTLVADEPVAEDEATPGSERSTRPWLRPRVLVPPFLGVAALTLVTVPYLQHRADVRWATQEALPEIRRLIGDRFGNELSVDGSAPEGQGGHEGDWEGQRVSLG